MVAMTTKQQVQSAVALLLVGLFAWGLYIDTVAWQEDEIKIVDKFKRSSSSSSSSSTESGSILSISSDEAQEEQEYQQPKETTPTAIPKRHFVMHVGPQKTATTWLQAVAFANQDILLQDNYTYDGPGKQSGPLFTAFRNETCRNLAVDARRAGGDQPLPSCWQDFQRSLDDLREYSILFSCETLNLYRLKDKPEYFDLLHEELVEKRGYQLTFVVAYRRLFEWLPSMYLQKSFGGVRSENWNTWPSHGGKNIKSFYPHVMSIDYVNRSHDAVHWYDWTIEHLQIIPDSMNVYIVDMHTPHSVEYKFFCQAIPYAQAMCEFVASGRHFATTEKGSANPSRPIWYDVLGIQAAENGLINTSQHTRTDVKIAIQKHQEDTLNRDSIDFPWRCLTKEELHQILLMSIFWERKILPDKEIDEDDFLRAFEKTVEKKKFCDIDSEATLAMEEWKTFFQNYAS